MICSVHSVTGAPDTIPITNLSPLPWHLEGLLKLRDGCGHCVCATANSNDVVAQEHVTDSGHCSRCRQQ